MAKKTTRTIPVEFGGVSLGQTTGRIGVHIDRGNVGLLDADELFSNHRLIGKVVLGEHGDDEDQALMFTDMSIEVAGAFDVKGFRVSADKLGLGLTYSLADVDVSDLAKFAKGSGRLVVDEIAEIPKEDKTEPDHVPGSLAANGPWAAIPLSDLFDGAILKNLKAAKIETIGQLQDFTAKDYQRLTDINGIGESAATKIENRMIQFWADNPQFGEDEAE